MKQLLESGGTSSTDVFERDRGPVRVIDLFCGGSGFALGAELAGATVVASFDNDADLTAAHKINMPKSELHNVDLAQVNPKRFASWILDTYGQIDGVIGGPPCQGFSEIGRRDASDIRNTLVVKFAEIVSAISPSFFVFENVPGLLLPNAVSTLDKAVGTLAAEYAIAEPLMLSARGHGVPTSRQRVFVYGAKAPSVQVPDVPIGPDLSATWPKATVGSAIRDLPEPIDRPWTDYPKAVWGRYRLFGNCVSHYARFLRADPPGDLSCKHSIDSLRAGWVSGNRLTRHTCEVKKRLSCLPQGKVDPVSKCPRLEWDGVSPTLRAGTGRDRGSYQAIRPIHPEEPRVITVREAARLQSFPDWFQFHPATWHAFRMIGNAVPPILARYVVRNMLRSIVMPRRS